MKEDNEVKIYPHPILDWHEIINDGIGDKKYALTYCPLTGTSLAWDRTINGQETTFGVSGLLYNTNLMPYAFILYQFYVACLSTPINFK